MLVEGDDKSALTQKSNSVTSDGNLLDVYYFYGEGCPHCSRVRPFLSEMENRYPLRIHRYDVYSNRDYLSVFDEYSIRYGLPLEDRAVPTVFISDTYFVGDSPILDSFEEEVKKSLTEGTLTDYTLKVESLENPDKGLTSEAGGVSILTLTIAGLVDSFSPCSIAILVFLIGARVLVPNKKKRILKVGVAFCLSVFIAYFLFGLGLLTFVQVNGFTNIFSLVVGLIAVLVGIFYLKDVFWYGKGGFVTEVPRSLKPLLMKMLKGVTSPIGAFVMGFVAVCFELPCTGGPYLFILGQLADSSTRLQAIPLLLYYSFLFVLPLVIISLLLYSNLLSLGKVREWNERNKYLLRFAGGFTMIILGFLTIPVSQLLQSIQLFLRFFRVVGPFISVMLSIYLAVTYAPIMKERLYFGTLLILLLGSSAFLIPLSTVAIANTGISTESTTTYISSCQELSTSGETYILTQDVSTTGDCFTIDASSVTLDCNGYTISGDGIGLDVGIGITELKEEIRITNCNIENFYAGIYGFQEAITVWIENNKISNNDIGIFFYMGNGVLIAHNSVVNNSDTGIILQEIQYCQIYNNFFNNTNNAQEIDVTELNVWDYMSVDCSSGPNIIGGPCIGGNYWTHLTGDGHSDTCTDSDGDGICDNPYVIPGGTSDQDNYPLFDITPPKYSDITEPSDPSPHTDYSYDFSIKWTDEVAVDTVILEFDNANYTDLTKSGDTYNRTFVGLSVGTHYYKWYANDTRNNWNSTDILSFTIYKACTNPITEPCVLDQPYTTYTLANDISTSGTCFTITNEYITLDCNGHTISGDGTGNGVEANWDLTTVKNCVINDFNYGYKINHYLVENVIEDSTLSYNNAGIFIYSSGAYNFITSNFITDNSYGIVTLYDGYSGKDYIYNNLFDNTKNVQEEDPGWTPKYWNTTYDCSAGPNIIGGPCIGGNYWGDYTGEDTDGDGMGDTPYVISGEGDNQDNYPLVDYTNPVVSILNPKQDKTHVGSSVSLTFTVDEQASWMGYSLDGGSIITIEGNTTLTGLSDGSHTVTVYARDIVGNEGSDTVDFTTDSSLAVTGGEFPLFEHI